MIVCMVVVRPSLRELDDGSGVAALGGEVGVVGVEGAGGVVGMEIFALELEPNNPLGLLNAALSSGNDAGGSGGVATGVAGSVGPGDSSLGGGRGSKPSTGTGIPSFNAFIRLSRACFSSLRDSSSPSHVPSFGTLKCWSGISPRLGAP